METRTWCESKMFASDRICMKMQVSLRSHWHDAPSSSSHPPTPPTPHEIESFVERERLGCLRKTEEEEKKKNSNWKWGKWRTIMSSSFRSSLWEKKGRELSSGEQKKMKRKKKNSYVFWLPVASRMVKDSTALEICLTQWNGVKQ